MPQPVRSAAPLGPVACSPPNPQSAIRNPKSAMTLALSLAAAAAPAPTGPPTSGAVSLGLVMCIVAFALVFDFLNGFHDAANSIATVVSTRVLSPTQAVIWAALFNFVAAFLFGTNVAGTIGKGLIRQEPQFLDVYVVFAGLLGAIIWNII